MEVHVFCASCKKANGVISFICVHADLQARTGQYTEKAAVVGLVVGVITLGLWSTGVLKSANSQPRQ